MYGVTTHYANIGTLIMDNHAVVTSYFVFNMTVCTSVYVDFSVIPTWNIVVKCFQKMCII